MLAAKDQPAIFASPFRFCFYAGVGFFIASVAMSVLTFLFSALVGLRTIGTLLRDARASQATEQKNAKVTVVSTDAP